MAEEQKKRGKGIYLLPNLFTTGALFAGFYAIITAIRGEYEHAAIAVFVAMVLDGLDGRVARLTNTQSDFGAEYDSLADMISFGLAPSLLMYQWALQDMGKLGWLAAFIYTAGAALRLARFNTQVGSADKRYFQGLASPAAAAIVAGFIWVCVVAGWNGEDLNWLAFAMTILAGVLMVSNVRYHSFKGFDLRGKVPFVTMLLVVLVFVFVTLDPPLVLFGLFLAYAVSGPVMTLFNLRRRREERRKQRNDGEGV